MTNETASAERGERPNDDQILAAMTKWGSRSMTYVICNTLWSDGFKVKTDWVRRQLMRLERAGRVHRVPSPYAVQICWTPTLKDTKA